jgi:hypothetical protein
MLRSSPVPKIDVRQGCDGFKKITLKCGAVVSCSLFTSATSQVFCCAQWIFMDFWDGQNGRS